MRLFRLPSRSRRFHRPGTSCSASPPRSARRPWQRVTDPERAASYFRARALHMLAHARDPLALVEHEERETARWATPTSTNTEAPSS
jgi:hypothetical protein